MLQPNQLKQVKGLINKEQSMLVIMGANASFDHKLAASSLYLALKRRLKDKKQAAVELLAPKALENKTIIGLDQLKTKLGDKNLLVSFDYDENAVGKVSYHIDEDNQKFYLTIRPKKGHDPLPTDTVKLEHTGSDADLVFLLGVKQLEELNQLYYGYEGFFRDTTTISLANFKADYADISLDLGQYSCLSEAMVDLIVGTDLKLDNAVATNLFAGIYHQTQHFTSLRATAHTFKTAAKLIEAGARRSSQKNDHEDNQQNGKSKQKESRQKESRQKTEGQQQKNSAQNSSVKTDVKKNSARAQLSSQTSTQATTQAQASVNQESSAADQRPQAMPRNLAQLK